MGSRRNANRRRLKVREYLMEKAGVSPLFCEQMKHGRVMAYFSDSAASDCCRKKIECHEKGSDFYETDIKKLEMVVERFQIFDQRLKSQWIAANLLIEDTTRQQIVDYIKKNCDIKVDKKDIYMMQTRSIHYALIRCANNSEARKAVLKQKMTKLNGAKILIEFERPLKGEDMIMVLTNLHQDVTEQDIKDHLKKHGKIRNAPKSIMWIPTKPDVPKKVKIDLDPNENLVKTVKNLNLSKLKEREVFVSWIRARRNVDKKKKGDEAKKQIIKTKNVKLNPFTESQEKEVSKLNTKKTMTGKAIKESKKRRDKQKGRKVEVTLKV